MNRPFILADNILADSTPIAVPAADSENQTASDSSSYSNTATPTAEIAACSARLAPARLTP